MCGKTPYTADSMQVVASLLLLALLACDPNLTRPDRGAFDRNQAPGTYFAQSELVAVDCVDDAPRLVPDQATIEVSLDDGTITVTGLPATMSGPLDPDGRFDLEGSHQSDLGPTTASMEGTFLEPDDGRGFLAILEEATAGCIQRYRTRAF